MPTFAPLPPPHPGSLPQGFFCAARRFSRTAGRKNGAAGRIFSAPPREMHLPPIRKAMKNIFPALFIILLAPIALHGQGLSLPAIYGDGMVLQRGKELRIRGAAETGTAVSIALLKEKQEGKGAAERGEEREGRRNKGQIRPRLQRLQPVARARATAGADGTWQALLPPLAAGGPYDLVVSGGGSFLIYKGVWVGEVWLCSGQSNMEMRVDEAATREADLAMADTLTRLHFYNMEARWPLLAGAWTEARADSADRGLFFRPVRWEGCSRRTAGRVSAAGFAFARTLADSLGCHVGLICHAVGGSTAEGWVCPDTLARRCPDVALRPWTENPHIMGWARRRAQDNLRLAGGEARHSHPYEPGYLWQYAVAPITGYGLKGVLWYQGESNAELPDEHARIFPALVSSWRAAWGQPGLPFFTVQLSALAGKKAWPAFREGQRRLAEGLPGVHLCVSTDLGDSLLIHYPRKRELGLRLAAQALHHCYGRTLLPADSPSPLRAERLRGEGVRVDFRDAPEGLRFLPHTSPSLFELRDGRGHWHAARCLIRGASVTLSSPACPDPRAVRYGWRDFYRGGLARAAGPPAPTFEMEVR